MGTYTLKNFPLQSGALAPQLEIAFQTFGQLDEQGSNAILFPTPFGATHDDLVWIAGEDGLFDAKRYFIIVVDTFGNGYSTSPHRSGNAPDTISTWQPLSTLDNVLAQQHLLQDLFGIQRLCLAAGWSMGGQQAYQWGVAYPEQVKRIAIICGSARTSPHNRVFLEGIQAALSAALEDTSAPLAIVHDRALRMLARLYAGWALSQDFYRDEVWRTVGYASLEQFLSGYWEAGFMARHPLNMLAQIQTWMSTDVSGTLGHSGDLRSALGSIQAHVLLMPCRQDLYFRVEDNLLEITHLRRARMHVLDSPWGHRAGLPRHSHAERRQLRAQLAALLAQES